MCLSKEKGACLSVCLCMSVYVFVCLSVGQVGNLTEQVTPSVLSLLIIFAVFVGVLYLLLWQTFVLWLEAVLIWIEMTFLGLELIFAFITVFTFARFLHRSVHFVHLTCSLQLFYLGKVSKPENQELAVFFQSFIHSFIFV